MPSPTVTAEKTPPKIDQQKRLELARRTQEAETYIHRIGRTARAGSEGQAWTFCSKEEAGLLLDIERLIKKPIPDDVEHDLHSERAFKSVRSPKKQQRRESRNGYEKKKPAKRRPRRNARFAR